MPPSATGRPPIRGAKRASCPSFGSARRFTVSPFGQCSQGHNETRTGGEVLLGEATAGPFVGGPTFRRGRTSRTGRFALPWSNSRRNSLAARPQRARGRFGIVLSCCESSRHTFFVLCGERTLIWARDPRLGPTKRVEKHAPPRATGDGACFSKHRPCGHTSSTIDLMRKRGWKSA